MILSGMSEGSQGKVRNLASRTADEPSFEGETLGLPEPYIGVRQVESFRVRFPGTPLPRGATSL